MYSGCTLSCSELHTEYNFYTTNSPIQQPCSHKSFVTQPVWHGPLLEALTQPPAEHTQLQSHRVFRQAEPIVYLCTALHLSLGKSELLLTSIPGSPWSALVSRYLPSILFKPRLERETKLPDQDRQRSSSQGEKVTLPQSLEMRETVVKRLRVWMDREDRSETGTGAQSRAVN